MVYIAFIFLPVKNAKKRQIIFSKIITLPWTVALTNKICEVAVLFLPYFISPPMKKHECTQAPLKLPAVFVLLAENLYFFDSVNLLQKVLLSYKLINSCKKPRSTTHPGNSFIFKPFILHPTGLYSILYNPVICKLKYFLDFNNFKSCIL